MTNTRPGSTDWWKGGSQQTPRGGLKDFVTSNPVMTAMILATNVLAAPQIAAAGGLEALGGQAALGFFNGYATGIATPGATSFTSAAHKHTPVGAITLSADMGSAGAYNAWTQSSEGASIGLCFFDGTIHETVVVRYEDASGAANECETATYNGWMMAPGQGASIIDRDFFGDPTFSGSKEFNIATLTGTPPQNYPVITIMFASEDSNIRLGTNDVIDVRLGSEPVWWDRN